jgi:carbonic anhydrase/acetyltransferase-like protein (isoleucine patch superfamily)
MKLAGPAPILQGDSVQPSCDFVSFVVNELRRYVEARTSDDPPLLVLFLFGVCAPLSYLDNKMIRSFKGMQPTIPTSCYVDESAQIIGDVVLGEHASVWMNAVLRGDVYAIRIGAHSNVQDCSVLHGMKNQYGVTLGEYVTVGHSVTLHGCVIEDRCLIGMGSIILNGAKIGAGSIIAAGTLIPERTVVEPGSLWMGSPGKFRRKLDEKDQESIMRYAHNYLGYTEEYLRER